MSRESGTVSGYVCVCTVRNEGGLKNASYN